MQNLPFFYNHPLEGTGTFNPPLKLYPEATTAQLGLTLIAQTFWMQRISAGVGVIVHFFPQKSQKQIKKYFLVTTGILG